MDFGHYSLHFHDHCCIKVKNKGEIIKIPSPRTTFCIPNCYTECMVSARDMLYGTVNAVTVIKMNLPTQW